jgi:hypothetical protein
MENQRTQPTSTWFAKKGESYFLHVAGIADDDVGEFQLEIEVRYYSYGILAAVRVSSWLLLYYLLCTSY